MHNVRMLSVKLEDILFNFGLIFLYIIGSMTRSSKMVYSVEVTMEQTEETESDNYFMFPMRGDTGIFRKSAFEILHVSCFEFARGM